MASLSSTDKNNLTKDQQQQVLALKKQWAAANAVGDKAGMESAHKQAEAIRNSAGYTGGSSGNSYSKVAANQGGQTADEVRQWAENYDATNYDPKKGWINGYSTAMNTRSKANYIRQQMDANSKAWHTADDATKEYLHQQNVELAKVLADYTGQSEKNYKYDPQTGKWWTWNTNVGYGSDLSWTQPNIAEGWREYYGYTDADRQRWDADTSRYYNFVDTRIANRNAMDESSGFTGQYSQFVGGPYAGLLHWGTRNMNPSAYQDSYNDGWGLYEKGVGGDVQYDANGNIIPISPVVRGNNALTDYTRKFASYTQNGVIQPNVLVTNKHSAVSGGDIPHVPSSGAGTVSGSVGNISGSGVKGGGRYDSYIRQMYDAILQAQLRQLEEAYRQNLSALDTEQAQVDSTYDSQKRQTSGTAAQQAAMWRETANAHGLNSGALGQAVLAQGNQLQGDLNDLRAAQAAAQAELMRQRTELGQKYRTAIEEAMAENNYEMVNALYEEAVRAEEALQEQSQFNANLALQYAKLAASMAKKTEKGE